MEKIAIWEIRSGFVGVVLILIGMLAGSVQAQVKAELEDNPIKFDAYKAKALENVHRLGLYLSIISNKSRSEAEKNTASEQALLLFASDTTIVEVSSVKNPEGRPRRIFVREYLRRLRKLDYKQVRLEWAEIAYASDFVKAPDGNYYATISVFQRFIGYGDSGEPVYEDITEKEIQVILTLVEYTREGVPLAEWNVLLGNIAVTETREV